MAPSHYHHHTLERNRYPFNRKRNRYLDVVRTFVQKVVELTRTVPSAILMDDEEGNIVGNCMAELEVRMGAGGEWL